MIHFRPVLYALVLVLALAAGCAGPVYAPDAEPALAPSASPTLEPTPTAAPVLFPGADWLTATPEQQGLDSARLADMLEYVRQKDIHMHSILVIRNGALVLEAYFDPYTAETPHQIASITKSVIGALVGIAVQQGKIESLQAPVVSFFPDRQIANLDARKQAMTLEHLLTLSPGLDCSDMQGTEGQMMQSADWVQFVLDLPMKADPGQEWAYCSSAVHLVSAILQQATGEDARSYANRQLFAPLGIAEVPPERWYSDPQGVTGGGNGLLLTPAEIARFAYLYLNGGRWKDQQVLPAGWVAESLTPHIEVGKMKAYGDMPRSYGYLWSLYPQQGLVSALGRNGQHIHFIPEENLLVVFTSATPVTTDERQFTLLKEYILPAVRSKTALAENPSAAARLEALVQHAAAPLTPPGALPAAAQALDGRTIRVGENNFGWQTLRFDFEAGQDTAEVSFNNGTQIQMGLDNLYRVQAMPGLGPVGFKAAWDAQGRLIIRQVLVGSWTDLEISIKAEGGEPGDKVTLFQHNVVDGGNLLRIEGVIE